MLASSAEGLDAFDGALLDSCALIRPPESLTISEWADKFGMLSAEGSSMPGKWYTSNAEYQREPMDVLSPGTPWQEVILMWASQVGKTAIVLFLAAYHIEHDPAPILFIEPSEDLCKVISKDRIDPMIRDTPRLKAIFDQQRGKKDTMHKPFPGGQLTFGWASSPAQLASRPIRILITDEEGRYDAAPNKEGDPVDQGKKRMATFGNRKHARVSSPALRRTCRITKAFSTSDQRRYYLPCPQCGHMQTLRWEQVKWPSGQPELAYYVCDANGCEITETDKFAMIRAGEWRAHNPGARTAGFHLNALYSTIGYTWGEIASDYVKCTGIPDKLQVFTNTVLAEPWDEEAEGVEVDEVASHAEEYAAPAPAWVVIITCGADVQKDRIEGTKWGWGLNDVSGVIEHRIFHGDPIREPEVWDRFEAWRRQPVPHESGLSLPVACTFVDSGDGNRTQAVYEYTKKNERHGVRACKGSSVTGAPLVERAKRVGRNRALLVMVGGSTAKDTIYSRLQIDEKDRPGYIHFPTSQASGCDSTYFSQLTSESLVTHQSRSGEFTRWEKQRRNEALDCAVYAYAAKEFTRAPLAALHAKLWARAARQPQLPADPPPKPGAEPQTKPAQSSSAASSPASISHPPVLRKRQRKTVKLPGYSWIHRN